MVCVYEYVACMHVCIIVCMRGVYVCMYDMRSDMCGMLYTYGTYVYMECMYALCVHMYLYVCICVYARACVLCMCMCMCMWVYM